MKRIIFFDGICALCNSFVNFVLKKDSHHRFRFSSLQSSYAKTQLPPPHLSLDSIVLKEGDQIYTKSTAILRILFQLSGPWNFFSIVASIFPVFFRDYVYQKVAVRRYQWFGKNEVCRLPTAEEKNYFLE